MFKTKKSNQMKNLKIFFLALTMLVSAAAHAQDITKILPQARVCLSHPFSSREP